MTTGRWTKDDETRLRQTFALRPLALLARNFGRTPEAVLAAARRVFGVVKPPRLGPARITEMRPYVGIATEEEIEIRTGLTPKMQSATRNRMIEAATSTKPLTGEELHEFKLIYGGRDDVYLRMKYGRTTEVIESAAREHRLAKDKAAKRRGGATASKMPRWTPDAVETLRSMYATTSNLEIAHALDRSVKSVVSKAHQLGLKKNHSRLREMGQENVKRRYQ